ncbi:MAG: hypothetical protein HY042_02330, partial [Spirochaetia bacterium]|nr:hypothetical protein [Spirochaetia bacterium]
MNLAILGGGPLAIVLARIASSRGRSPHVWLREKEKSGDQDLHSILPAATFVPSLSTFGTGSWTFFVCVASAQAEDVITRLVESVDPHEEHTMLVFTEGILSADMRRRTGAFGFAEYAEHLASRRKLNSFTTAAAGGPNLITELQESAHTFVLLGTHARDKGMSIGEQLRADFIHVDYTDDLRGVEIGGALKNPISMAAGIVAGLPRTGGNVLGEFVAAGYREILLLGTALGGKVETLNGRAGLADLLANAFSPRSRNRTFGRQFVHRIMEGVDEPGLIERVQNFFRPAGIIEREMSRADYLAEGGYALASIMDMAKELKLDLPVYTALHAVLSRKAPPELLLEQVTGPIRSGVTPPASADQRPAPTSRRPEEDVASAVKRRVLDYFRNAHNAKAVLKASAIQVEDQSAKGGRLPETERLVMSTIKTSEGATLWTAVNDLTTMYARDIAGSLTDRAPKAADEFDYPKLGLHVTPLVSGAVDEVRKAAAKNALVYAATHRSHLDPVEIVAGLGAVGLPLPR